MKISIELKDDIKQLREEFIQLIHLGFRLEWAGTKISFEREEDNELYPDDFEYFHFTKEEEKTAKEFRDELLMAHISALPRETVDWLIFRRSMGYEDDTHVYDDKRYLEQGLVDNGWEFKAAVKLIDSWSIELLKEKIKKEKE